MPTHTEPSDHSTLPTSLEVRDRIVEALNLDLVGPGVDHGDAEELLPRWQRPSTWYLTGFLAPRDAPPEQAADEDEADDLGVEATAAGLVEEAPQDPVAAKKVYYPSSIGLSLLVAEEAKNLNVRVAWGDYVPDEIPKQDDDADAVTRVWRRLPNDVRLEIPIGAPSSEPATEPVPDSRCLEVHVLVRDVPTETLQGRIPLGTRSVSVFLVNARLPDADMPDRAYAFQPRLEINCDVPIVPRPDLRGLQATDWDDQVADLHYAATHEYATGHGISAEWDEIDGECRVVRTAWIPSAEVEKTMTAHVPEAELGMDALGRLGNADDVRAALAPLSTHYREWIASRGLLAQDLAGERRSVAEELLRQAALAAERIERGVEVLERDEEALDAFRVANRAVAEALRHRLDRGLAPTWRPFQLAFLLLNLPGVADPTHPERNVVDLLFFPTGGGKTEAYLGLAAFTIVLRRLRHGDAPGALTGAGVAVVMRYTLRLLTLDQLGRAAGLMCALELERQANEHRYGVWPFEIGLWVGRAATPNAMGRKGDGKDGTARSKVNRYKTDPRYRAVPIPLENCPWCGTKFEPDSFNLVPDSDRPRDLKLTCMNFECDFSGGRTLPIVAVDEPVYRRLPAFLIATVDKFAALPWTGNSGVLLGGADRYDPHGFYGASEPSPGRRLPKPLDPPDLIIQDELHLISGPLGTMAGLFETAIDALCTRDVDGVSVKPKVVASTATARRARDQVLALFGRARTELFPPPGPDRRDSFFARVVTPDHTPARLYLGVAAQGRNAKVVMRRAWLALMGAAEKAYRDAGGDENPNNPADPYMTVVGYFNSLRELGGARRILEEEVRQTIRDYGARKRVNEPIGLFHDRRRIWDVVELTSRVPTHEVSEAKRRLELPANEDRRVDCAVATNMISVGLDITRLGLMVVLGQPKTHAEYIQATSRVGRANEKPGLVLTLLNLAKPRDRSHYERFRHYHQTFYRSVEVASVTPFAARALDRGFAATLIALARHLRPALTRPTGAHEILRERTELEDQLRRIFTARVDDQQLNDLEHEAVRHSVESRIPDLLDAWAAVQARTAKASLTLQYQAREETGKPPLLREILDRSPDPIEDAFRLNRSLRDVEPDVTLYLENLPTDAWRAPG
jgi:hypothetical protein